MHGGRSSEKSVNKFLMEGHAESPNGFVIISQNFYDWKIVVSWI